MLNKEMRGVATGGSRWNKLWTAPRAVLLGACATAPISHATMETSGRIRQERKHPPGLQLRHANAEAGGGSIKSSAASAAQDVGDESRVAEKAAAAVTPTSDEDEAAREVEKASFLRTGKSKTRQRNPPPGVPPGGVGSPVVLPQMQLPPPPPPHFPLPHFAPPHFPPPSTYPYPNPKHMHNGHGDATTSKSTCCADDEDEAVNMGLPNIYFPTNPSGQAPTSTGATSSSIPTPGLSVTPVEPEPEDLTKATNLPPGISEVFALRGDELLSSGQFELKHMNEPTNGNVHYVDDEELLYKKLPGTKQGKLIMDDQWQNQGYAHGKQHGYKSFRFVSNPTLGPGTVLMWDAEHIPVGHGVWPAYWTVDVSCWPDCGEIDMHEGINMDDHMHSKLHTGNKIVSHPTCRALICHDAKNPDSNDCKNPDCYTDFNNGAYGCGGEWKRPNGKAYNDAGGALHVLAWTKKWLKMWLWKRNEIPKGLKWNDVSDLGKLADGTMPDAYATWSFEDGKCDHKELNGRHNFIINLTTCGDWAGSVYNHNGGTGPDACKQYIKTEEARNAWKELNNGEMPHYLLNSLRLYKVNDLR